MTDDVGESRARIVATTNAARRNLERLLHDGPQQHLTALAVKLRLAEQAVEESPVKVKAMLEELREDVQATIQQLREVAASIYPALLTDRGLSEALRAAAGRAHGEVRVEVDDSIARYKQDVEAAIYFACVDAMRSSPMSIELTAVSEDEVRLVFTGAVQDAMYAIKDGICTVGGAIEAAEDGQSLTATLHVGAHRLG
jgi:signal transduction histidine kinase